jgi:hypothetical protein
MAMVEVAVSRRAVAWLITGATNAASPDHTRPFLVGALALVVAAAAWLAFEVHRLWSADPTAGSEGVRRVTDEVEHPLVPQLVAEIMRLNALIAELRDAREPPISKPADADLATWALAGLEERVAARRDSLEARGT